jgi:hypothetical protein
MERKSSNKPSDDEPLYVTVADCQTRHTRLELALFGEDGRGGLVKDVQEIKTSTNVFRSIALPVIISLATALITAYFLKRI